MRRLAALSLVIALAGGAPAEAAPSLRGTLRAVAKPLRSRPVRATARVIARPFRSRPARAVGRAIKTVFTLDTLLIKQGKRLAARTRRARAARFDRRVRAVSSIPSVIQIGRRGRRDKLLAGEQLRALQRVAAPLLRGMKGVAVTVTDPISGARRKLTRQDLADALRVVRAVDGALAGRSIRASSKKISLAALLRDERVAAAFMSYWTRESKPGTAGRQALQARYRAALTTLTALDKAYTLYLHWPGVKQGKADLARLSARHEGGDALVVVAVRRRAPGAEVAAMRELTHKHFKGITHLWFDPLFAGKPGAVKQAKSKLADPKARKLVDRLVAFRDSGAVKVIAVSGGKRSAALEGRIARSLAGMNRGIARRVLRTDFYLQASEGTKESFLRTVAIGSGMGFAMDGIAEATHNPTLLKWKPTVLGGWDDAVGGAINAMEMRDNGHGKGVLLDAGIATSIGLGTSFALGASLRSGGQSIANLMLNPATPLLPRVLASGLYGVASSGATFTMSFLPARHYKRPILELVGSGKIEAPTDRAGLPLKGRALKRWARRQGLKAHLAYTAQKGGLIGVGLSGVLTAGFGLIPGWGGPAAANILLGVGGAAETLTTGGYLYAREALDRRAIERSAQKYLSQAAK